MSKSIGEAPVAAQRVLSEKVVTDLTTYGEILASLGVERGLIGPREPVRLWERHLLNCAALSELIDPQATVVDVGTGAGLPGLVLAICRPDCRIHLVEPMLRRVNFLEEVIDYMGLTHVTVHRARAEEVAGKVKADVVTARAVAPLSRLLGWTWPLLNTKGALFAMKGVSAEEEIKKASSVLRRIGAAAPEIVYCGAEMLGEPARVVVVRQKSVSNANLTTLSSHATFEERI